MGNELISQFEEADRAVNTFAEKISEYVSEMYGRVNDKFLRYGACILVGGRALRGLQKKDGGADE